MMHQWNEFNYRGYSAVAIKIEDEWGGEFNFPIRRFIHAFFGQTKAEAEKEFRAGVEFYISKISEIPGLSPEQQGMAGILELMEMERRSVDFELRLLAWPKNVDPAIMDEVVELIKSTRRPLSYNQSAIDELAVWLDKHSGGEFFEFKDWAGRVWRTGQLDTTREGLSIARAREEAFSTNTFQN